MAAPRSKKKKTTTKKSFSLKNLSWHEAGEKHLQDYLKKIKGESAGLISVLSSYGDVVLKAGAKKSKELDWTSLGSIFSAVKGTADGLNSLLKTHVVNVQFGDQKSRFWVELGSQEFLVVGLGVTYKKEWLAPLIKHLKNKAKSATKGSSEALDGLNETSIDAALRKEMK